MEVETNRSDPESKQPVGMDPDITFQQGNHAIILILEES